MNDVCVLWADGVDIAVEQFPDLDELCGEFLEPAFRAKMSTSCVWEPRFAATELTVLAEGIAALAFVDVCGDGQPE